MQVVYPWSGLHPWIGTGNQALASHSPLNNQALAICVFELRRGHHYGETWPRSSTSSTRAPETDISRQCTVLNLRPSQPQAGTLPNIYLDSYTTHAKPIKIKIIQNLRRGTYTDVWSDFGELGDDMPRLNECQFTLSRAHSQHLGRITIFSTETKLKVLDIF